jgi:hypothetical protein
MKKHLILLSLFLIISCTQEEIESSCDQTVLIDSYAYINNESSFFNINSVEIIDDCLSINFSSSGCSANSWQVNLIDSEAILESFPAQRSLIFSLENKEICLAYITKDISFDISSLQLNNQTSLLLNIENGENDFQILYEY